MKRNPDSCRIVAVGQHQLTMPQGVIDKLRSGDQLHWCNGCELWHPEYPDEALRNEQALQGYANAWLHLGQAICEKEEIVHDKGHGTEEDEDRQTDEAFAFRI